MIKGADELIKKVSKPVADITNNIAELEAEKERLTDSLDNSDNQFSMDVVKKNKAIEADIHLINNTIDKAKKRKEEMIRSNADEVYSEAKQTLSSFRKDVNEKHKTDNQLIIDAIDEVRSIYKEFKEKDKEYSLEAVDFIEAISPYLDPRKKEAFGAIGTQKRQLELMNERRNTRTYLSWLDIVREDFFKIDGLIADFKDTPSSNQERAKYVDDSK